MADFSLVPDFVFVTKISYKTAITEYENGIEQRRALWSSSLKTWQLVYEERGNTDIEIITTLFDSKKGASSSFTWTNPKDNVDYTVRFEEDDLELIYNPNLTWSVSFKLKQVK